MMMTSSKKKEFDKVLANIKNIKIQGARNIAKAALYAYSLSPTELSKRRLLGVRPTEPMMKKVLNLTGKKSYKDIFQHFDSAQSRINKIVFKLLKDNDIILTHCHSTNVVNSLIYAKRHKKRFEVYVTETRPLFQGRKTAKELRKIGIKVTMFIDSSLNVVMSGEQRIEKPSRIFIGADALLEKGVINKIGSGLISKVAKDQKISLYIIADSWKFTKQKIPLEQRKLNEIWNHAPKNIKIKNPAFEFVPEKYISGIVTEHGLMKYNEFVKRMKKEK